MAMPYKAWKNFDMELKLASESWRDVFKSKRKMIPDETLQQLIVLSNTGDLWYHIPTRSVGPLRKLCNELGYSSEDIIQIEMHPSNRASSINITSENDSEKFDITSLDVTELFK